MQALRNCFRAHLKSQTPSKNRSHLLGQPAVYYESMAFALDHVWLDGASYHTDWGQLHAKLDCGCSDFYIMYFNQLQSFDTDGVITNKIPTRSYVHSRAPRAEVSIDRQCDCLAKRDHVTSREKLTRSMENMFWSLRC